MSDIMYEILTPVFEKRNKCLENRPFNKDGERDANFNYIHQIDCTDMIIEAFKLGLKYGRGI